MIVLSIFLTGTVLTVIANISLTGNSCIVSLKRRRLEETQEAILYPESQEVDPATL
jgi:hypothetical protein